MPTGVYQRKPFTEEHRRNMGKGRPKKLSKAWRKKLSEAHLGYCMPESQRKNIGESHKGEKHWQWKGGISKDKKHACKKSKEFRKRHPEKVRFWRSRAKVRKRNAPGSHTFEEWSLLKKSFNYTCPACGRKEPEIKLTEDHIVPLSKGGSDFISNIQPLCHNCNSSKNMKAMLFENLKSRKNKKSIGQLNFLFSLGDDLL